MSLCTIGTRSVVTVEPATPVVRVAGIMEDRSVGSVVVVDGDRPVGIITDRDLVTRVLAPGKDPAALTARDVMTAPLKTVSEADEALKAATLMREAHVRRLPVLSGEGRLVGIIALDDLTYHLSRCYHEMAEAIAQFPVPHAGG